MVKLSPSTLGGQDADQKGFVTYHPERGINFRPDLFTGLCTSERERGGGELSVDDAALLGSIFGLLSTDDACQLCGDPAVHRPLCEAIGLADPDSYGRPNIVLQLSSEEGTPKGLARLLRGCLSVLKPRPWQSRR